jgi:hypothetical protein
MTKNDGLNSFITLLAGGTRGTTCTGTLFGDFFTALAHPFGGAG